MANEKINIVIQAFNKTRPAFNTLARGLDGIKKSIFNVKTGIAGLVGAAGFGAFVKSTVETNKKFQSLQATLKTFLGTTEKASGAFNVLSEFASRTPFGVDEVVKSFNKMVALGLNPTITALDSFGNIASGTGKTLEQFVEAAADAAVGEFERLKEFGVKARSEGDKVTFTFSGVETTIKKDAASIQGYLENLGNTKFAGATAEQAKTLGGAFSNLRDSFENFQRQIGEGGLNDAVNAFAIAISEILRDVPELATAIGEGLGKAIDFITKSLKDGIPAIRDFASNFEERMITAAFEVVSALEETRKALNLFGILDSANLTGPLIMLGEALENLKMKQVDVDGSTKAVKASMEELDKQLAKNTPKIATQEGQWKGIKDALDEYTASLPELDKALGQVAVDGFKSLEDGILGIIDGTKSAKDAFKDMARSIVNDLLRIAIQQSITGPLAGAFGGFFGARAIGGPVQRNGTYLVGERGPELLTMGSRGGHIIPNSQLSSGGGVTVNQTINVSTGVSQTVRSEIMALMPQIAEASKSAVADAKQRGGSLGRSL
jgi:hypothetical protein